MNLVRLALYNSEIERLLNDKTNAGDRPWGGVFGSVNVNQVQVGGPQVPLLDRGDDIETPNSCGD